MEMCYGMVAYDPALKAATAIFLSAKALKTADNSLTDDLGQSFSVSPSQISASAMNLLVFWSEQDSNDKLTSIKRKFAQDCHSGVSNIKPALSAKN